ncbi:MAG: TolC family protein [Elusimicrobia bacterium]|nr:TolC family protein [Elusimicrobiota bacterium]
MKWLYRFSFFVIAILTAVVQSWAELPLSGAMALAEAVAAAKERNPDILAARKRWESAQALILPAKTWPDPELGVEYWGFPKSGLNVGAAPEKWYDVSQAVPFPGKLSLRGKAASHKARQEEELYRATERDVLTKLKEAYFDLLYADRAIGIFKESVEAMRRFARIAESKYSVGKASQSDVLRAQVELSKMLNMLVTLDQDRETLQARLNAILDRDPEEPVVPTEEPPLAPFDHTFADLERMALENRPEIHAASHHVDHMKAELAASRADYLPDTMIQYSRRMMEGQRPDAIAMLKLNLPFVWFWRQNSLIKSVKSEKDHADAMLRSARAMTRYETKEFLVHVQTSRRLVDLYKTTVLSQAEQSLRVAEAAYQSEKIGFLELLDSERALIEFRLEYEKYLAQYGVNLAHLERVVGVDFLNAQKEERK